MGQGERPQVLLRYAALLRPHPQGRGELRYHRLLFQRQRAVCGKEVHGILTGKAGLEVRFDKDINTMPFLELLAGLPI